MESRRCGTHGVVDMFALCVCIYMCSSFRWAVPMQHSEMEKETMRKVAGKPMNKLQCC